MTEVIFWENGASSTQSRQMYMTSGPRRSERKSLESIRAGGPGIGKEAFNEVSWYVYEATLDRPASSRKGSSALSIADHGTLQKGQNDSIKRPCTQ